MHFLAPLLHLLEHSGPIGYLIVFVVAFAEAVAVIGAFVPGATLIVLSGFLAAHGYLSLMPVIVFAATGAIAGDSFSYWLGTRGTHLFKDENRLLKRAHLEQGKKFFEKHGKASIFWGRFVGPIRPIIPFVAGLSRMNKRSFMFWNVASGIAWALFHVLLGYFFSGSIQAVAALSRQLALAILAVIAIAAAISFIIHRSRRLERIAESVQHSVKTALKNDPEVTKFVHEHRSFFRFFKRHLDRKEFKGLPLTILALAFLYTALIFTSVVESVINSAPIVAVDIRVEALFFLFRTPSFTRIFLWITTLGNAQVVAATMLVSFAIFWLISKKEWIVALGVTVIGSELFAVIGKMLVHRARPGQAIPFYIEQSFSFPSGHATIAVALYGMLGYFIFKAVRLKKTKSLVIALTALLILAIGWSRLYLGVHFLSDVIGGYLIGLLWLIVGIGIEDWYRFREHSSRRIIPSGPRQETIILLLAALGFFMAAYAGSYRPTPNSFVAQTTLSTISGASLENFAAAPLPKYVESLSGLLREPLNFIIVSPGDASLVASFRKAGWRSADPLGIRSVEKVARAIILSKPYPTAPMTPSFWNGEVNSFNFEKPTPANSIVERHHVRFWKTSLVTADGQHVYVGTASFDSGIKWLGFTHRISPAIDDERETLFSDLLTSGQIAQASKEALVGLQVGTNFTGDPFYTDGSAYLIFLAR